jgi:hypothetical protein
LIKIRKEMKSRIILFSIIAFLCFSFIPDACKISYNGIYAIKLDEEHSAVLRFYEDGTVLASTSVNDYMDVMTWFNKENKDMVLKGKYKIKKCSISFSVNGQTGDQEYDGTIEDNKLNLKLTNKETKKYTTRTYTFFAL